MEGTVIASSVATKTKEGRSLPDMVMTPIFWSAPTQPDTYGLFVVGSRRPRAGRIGSFCISIWEALALGHLL
ncbi:hypothetical protein, partial [Methyloceanibacter marginalis]|uniref:hypothetical protein n=1 Tax=Methyloceanibacter marginalis TaxID=1774971 RepID=UPI00195E3D23